VRHRRRVLIAEDSTVVRALLRSQLAEHGYEVIETEDGGAALARAQELRPEVILLDVDMPVMSGFEVVDRLKQDPDLADIPVVFITGRTDPEDAVKGLDLGAHDYLRKPFEPTELAARVQAAMRIKHLQDDLRELNAELAHRASTDQLTGLPNRRFLDEQLTRACAGAKRHERPLALLMIDVDHFKRVNDEFGHQVGDEVLACIAGRLGARLRADDVLGRWGGEEFMVVANATVPEGARRLAEDLRAGVAAEPLDVRGTPLALTISIGWSAYDGGTPEDLVRRADRALYAAKEAGRDTVVGDAA
jgi:two-component system, cell cycle response regulator